MQRRSVAVYVAIFLLLGIGSYTLVATGEQPDITIEDPEYALEEADTLSIDGTTYTVSTVDAEEEEEGHGGGTHTVYLGELSWTEIQAQSDTWGTDDVVEVGQTQWVVSATSGALQLVEQQDREAILQADSTVENKTQQIDGVEYVVRRNPDGEPTLVEADEFFEPATRELAAGETFEYRGTDATLETVANESGEITWREEAEQTLELGHESNVSVGGQEYFVFFPDGNQVYLTTDYASYRNQVQQIGTFNQRADALWRIIVLSFISAALMAIMAFLPSRY